MYFWITKGFCYEIRGEKQFGDINYTFGGGGGCSRFQLKIKEGVIEKEEK